MGKSKKTETDNAVDNDADVSTNDNDALLNWEEKTKYLSPISSPLASKKLTKKIYKTVKKAHKAKSLTKGVKAVQRGLRKGETGIVILAGDVYPLDIISHIPVLCEEKGLQYCFVPSKRDLGETLGNKRQTCLVMIKDHKSIQEEYNECMSKIKEIPITY